MLQTPNGFYNGFYKGSYSSYTVSTETVTLYYKRPCNLKVLTAETPRGVAGGLPGVCPGVCPRGCVGVCSLELACYGSALASKAIS